MLYHLLCLTALSAAASAQVGSLNLLYQFPAPPPTGLENLAIRPNGNLLLNALTAPTVYELDPSNPVPQEVVTLTSGTAALQGIAEYSYDAYAIVTGNYSFNPANPGPPAGVPGSFQVWTLDLNGSPSAQFLTAIPEASALNGAATVPGCSDIVLIADSGLGAVWQVNVKTGAYKPALQDPLFAPNQFAPLGINGIEVHGSYLYFTNSAQGIYGKIQINAYGNEVSAAGAAQVIGAGSSPQTSAFDDFAIDSQGTAYIATQTNAITAITQDGQVAVVAGGGNDTTLLGPTSVAIDSSGCTLYITTQGDFTTPLGGQVFSLGICGKWKRFTA